MNEMRWGHLGTPQGIKRVGQTKKEQDIHDYQNWTKLEHLKMGGAGLKVQIKQKELALVQIKIFNELFDVLFWIIYIFWV